MDPAPSWTPTTPRQCSAQLTSGGAIHFQISPSSHSGIWRGSLKRCCRYSTQSSPKRSLLRRTRSTRFRTNINRNGSRPRGRNSACASRGDEDEELIKALLSVMHKTQADYTATFSGLADYLEEGRPGPGVDMALEGHPDFQAWMGRWWGARQTGAGVFGCSGQCHAPRQPEIHTAEPSNRGSDRSSHRRRFRAL